MINEILKEFVGSKLHSKGFFPEATVEGFPIRGKNVFLHITSRRWFNESTGKVVTRDWDLVAKGARITSEFTAFFKRTLFVLMLLAHRLWLSSIESTLEV